MFESGQAQPLGRGRIVHDLAKGHGERLGSWRAHFAVHVVGDKLRGTAAVGARDDRLPRCKRFDRDEPVVFVVRRKAHGAALREVLEHLAIVDAADQRHARRESSGRDGVLQRPALLTLAGDDAPDARRFGVGERVDQAATDA